MKDNARIPKNYKGIQPTGRSLSSLLPKVLEGINQTHALRPDLVLAAWPELVGEKIAKLSKAVKFEGGCLLVKVKSSTLLNILQQYEKKRLIGALKKQFPDAGIKNIIFRIG